jgi:hypothetical protein
VRFRTLGEKELGVGKGRNGERVEKISGLGDLTLRSNILLDRFFTAHKRLNSSKVGLKEISSDKYLNK